MAPGLRERIRAVKKSGLSQARANHLLIRKGLDEARLTVPAFFHTLLSQARTKPHVDSRGHPQSAADFPSVFSHLPLPPTVKPGRSGRKRRPHTRVERGLRDRGYHLVAGVDEVGRGCLFGPVAAAAVILDPRKPVRGLNDSKQLDPERRRALSLRIRERALAVSVAAVDSAQIDRVNIYQASRWAMKRAVLGLHPAAEAVVVDALSLDLDLPQRSIIRGDATCSSVAAASIVAKVERDRWMEEWDAVFPQYGLASNKGYGSAEHLAALREHGPTPLHRMTFAPVAECSLFGPVADPQGLLPFASPDNALHGLPS